MKQRIVTILLLLFTVWPLVQHALVRRYEVNPWKLAGWAMYAQPHVAPDVDLLVVRSGRGELIDEAAYGQELLDMSRAYAQARDHIGKLAGAPNDLGLALLQRYPQEGVLVLVKHRRLNVETNLIEVDLEQHLYLPDGTVKRGVRTMTGP